MAEENFNNSEFIEDDIEEDDDPCDVEQEVVCANNMGADHFHVQ